MIWYIVLINVLITVLAIRVCGLTRRICFLERDVEDLRDERGEG